MRSLYPSYFKNTTVLDIGSANICGTNRFLFKNCSYLGVDVLDYDNVDIVCEAKRVDLRADTVICAEMLEHDPDWKESLANMVKMADKCLIVTCATNPRKRHGTYDTTPKNSPFKGISYYGNIPAHEFLEIISGKFSYCLDFRLDVISGDMYFLGIKDKKPKFSPSITSFLYHYTKIFFLNRCRDIRNFFG